MNHVHLYSLHVDTPRVLVTQIFYLVCHHLDLGLVYVHFSLHLLVTQAWSDWPEHGGITEQPMVCLPWEPYKTAASFHRISTNILFRVCRYAFISSVLPCQSGWHSAVSGYHSTCFFSQCIVTNCSNFVSPILLSIYYFTLDKFSQIMDISWLSAQDLLQLHSLITCIQQPIGRQGSGSTVQDHHVVPGVTTDHDPGNPPNPPLSVNVNIDHLQQTLPNTNPLICSMVAGPV